MQRILRYLSALLVALLAVPAVHAVDGVVEINQARASTGGVTPGDTPGFPITIDTAGSYRLTGNLTPIHKLLAPQNVTTIVVTADDVWIDLNGFSIIGPCSGGPPCVPVGSGLGIDASESAGVTVTNGGIRGVGNRAIELYDRGRVAQVQVSSTGGAGVRCESGCEVVECRFQETGGAAIWADGSGGIVRGNTVVRSGSDGIFARAGSVVEGNAVYRSEGDGIRAIEGSTIRGNSVYLNQDDGIQAGSFDSNANVVLDNLIEDSDEWGLKLTGKAAYGRNVISGAKTVEGGVEIAPNLCNFDTACP